MSRLQLHCYRPSYVTPNLYVNCYPHVTVIIFVISHVWKGGDVNDKSWKMKWPSIVVRGNRKKNGYFILRSAPSALTVCKCEHFDPLKRAWTSFFGPKNAFFLHTPKKFTANRKGGGVNAYGQPDCKIYVFFYNLPRRGVGDEGWIMVRGWDAKDKGKGVSEVRILYLTTCV